MASMDEAQKMRALEQWLDGVCDALALDRSAVQAVTPALLELAAQVAHGPARPGAPLTAFAVGMAAGRAGSGNLPGDVTDALAAIRPLLEPYA